MFQTLFSSLKSTALNSITLFFIFSMQTTAYANSPSGMFEIGGVNIGSGYSVFECLPDHKLSIHLLTDIAQYPNLDVYSVDQNQVRKTISYTRNNKFLDINCGDLAQGPNSIRVTDGKQMGSYPMNALPSNGFFIEELTLDGYQVTLKGRNLNQAVKLQHNNGMLEINDCTSANDCQFTLPSNFAASGVYFHHSHGKSKGYTLIPTNEQARMITADLPPKISFDGVVISTSFDNETPLTVEGANVNIDINKAKNITLIKYTADDYFVIGYAPVLPEDKNVHANSTTMAVGLLWLFIKYDWSNSDARQTLDSIYQLDSVKQFGEFIYAGVSKDLAFLEKGEHFKSPLYKQTINDINQLVASK